MLAQKAINTTSSKREERALAFKQLNGKVEYILNGCTKDDSIIYLDACYLLDAIKAGLKATDVVFNLSQYATVVITREILKEVERNLTKAEFSRERRGEAVTDLMMLYSLSQLYKDIVVEEVAVTVEEQKALSERMGQLDPSGNRRAGAGESSIFTHLVSVKEFFQKAIVISNDADVGYLFQGMDVSVLRLN